MYGEYLGNPRHTSWDRQRVLSTLGGPHNAQGPVTLTAVSPPMVWCQVVVPPLSQPQCCDALAQQLIRWRAAALQPVRLASVAGCGGVCPASYDCYRSTIGTCCCRGTTLHCTILAYWLGAAGQPTPWTGEPGGGRRTGLLCASWRLSFALWEAPCSCCQKQPSVG